MVKLSLSLQLKKNTIIEYYNNMYLYQRFSRRSKREVHCKTHFSSIMLFSDVSHHTSTLIGLTHRILIWHYNMDVMDLDHCGPPWFIVVHYNVHPADKARLVDL